MRTRSPSNAPPVNGDVGSTAITPTVRPASRKRFTRSAVIVLLPAPGGPVRPMRLARPVRAWRDPSSSSNPSRWFSTMLTTRASAAGFPALKSSTRRLEDARKDPLLPEPHGRHSASCAQRMTVAKTWSVPWIYKSQQLLAKPICPGLWRFPVRFRRRCRRLPLWHPVSRPGESKRNHVGWTVVPEVAMVKLRHCGPPNERNR